MATTANHAGGHRRRSFLKRAGAAAAGAAAAAPLVGSASARAAGTNPAYTDAANVWTANQRINADLGIGAPAQRPVRLQTSDLGWAMEIDAYDGALLALHTVDWAGACHDLVDLFHKSTGDAVFVAHKGGGPPGYSGPSGGNAALNTLIPYYLDDTGTGRNGSVVNNRSGMQGLFVQSQATRNTSPSVQVLHFARSAAIYLANQSSNAPTAPANSGLVADDWGTASAIKIGKYRAPAGGNDAIISLLTSVAAAYPALRVADGSGTAKVLVKTDGTAAFGTGNPFAVRLQADMPATGVARNLSLSNSTPAQGGGVQVEFDDHTSTYARIQGVYDQRGPVNGALRFSVASGGRQVEQLRLSSAGMTVFAQAAAFGDASNFALGTQNGTKVATGQTQKLAFYGAKPVAAPALTYSRSAARETAGEAQIRRALASLGLVIDRTSA